MMRYFLFFCACLSYGQITQGGGGGGGGGVNVPGAGMVKSNGTVLQTAIVNTDYLASSAIPAAGMVKSSGTALQTAVQGTDYLLNKAYSNGNTSTASNIVVIGDSHMVGLGQTTPIVNQLVTTYTYTITNLAVSGCKFCAYWADRSVHEASVDALFNPLARSNILIIEGGGNDMIDNNTGLPAVPWITAQQVFDCQKSFALRRQAVGWLIVLYPMYSRTQTGIGGQTGDQLHNALNALYAANWRSFADAYHDTVPNIPAVWNDNDKSGACFQADAIHVASSCTAALASRLSTAINQAEAGTGAPNSVLGSLSVSNNATGAPLVLQNRNVTDFTSIIYTNSVGSNVYLAGTGNASSAWPGHYILYDMPAGLTRFDLLPTTGDLRLGAFSSGTSDSGDTVQIYQDSAHTHGLYILGIPNGATPNGASLRLKSSDGVGSWDMTAFSAGGVGGYLGIQSNTASTAPLAIAPDTVDQALWMKADGLHFGSHFQMNTANKPDPVCDDAHRGTFSYQHPGSGLKDVIRICVSNGSTFIWTVIY